MRIVCISDTHGRLGEVVVPEGDVLVCAGDFTRRGTEDEIRAFARALHALPHPEKVVVAGNHDFLFERDPERARALLGDVRYLRDEGVSIDGRSFWGSPWQPEFCDWAFNLPRGAALAERWALVPDATDVLVTHGPPRGVLDVTVSGEAVGCDDLARELRRIAPRLHVFGHIHEAYGRVDADGTIFVNASICDVRYAASHRPIVVDL
ncbi:MAG: metallophosphatase domain-containing protein [Planctomycetota bacterium JB042]